MKPDKFRQVTMSEDVWCIFEQLSQVEDVWCLVEEFAVELRVRHPTLLLKGHPQAGRFG